VQYSQNAKDSSVFSEGAKSERRCQYNGAAVKTKIYVA